MIRGLGHMIRQKCPLKRKMPFNPENTKNFLQFYLNFTTIYLQFNLIHNFLLRKSQKNRNKNHDET